MTKEKKVTVEAKEATAVKCTVFTVFNAFSTEMRTYSVEVHGQEAEKLAQTYAEKIGGFVKGKEVVEDAGEATDFNE